MDIVRGWHDADNPLFRFQGGRLLAIAFPTVRAASRREAPFSLQGRGRGSCQLCGGHLGKLRRAVHPSHMPGARRRPFHGNDDRLGSVECSAPAGTGVVSGEVSDDGGAYRASKKDAAALERTTSTKKSALSPSNTRRLRWAIGVIASGAASRREEHGEAAKLNSTSKATKQPEHATTPPSLLSRIQGDMRRRSESRRSQSVM